MRDEPENVRLGGYTTAKFSSYHVMMTIFLYYLQVKKRFMDLLNLFKASSGEGNRDSINEDSCSEEEEDDDSETVGESEGEQPRD